MVPLNLGMVRGEEHNIFTLLQKVFILLFKSVFKIKVNFTVRKSALV